MTAKKERTRALILETSYTLFAQHGFSKITMKDICDATNLSRGGLYSHFSSPQEIFETILEGLNQKDEMNFYQEMESGVAANVIMDRALLLMEREMASPQDSLSLAIYEYSGSVDANLMCHFNQSSEQKWAALIRYGIEGGEFYKVDIEELVRIILYSYQGVRMWSRIIPMTPDVFRSITSHIKKQLYRQKV